MDLELADWLWAQLLWPARYIPVLRSRICIAMLSNCSTWSHAKKEYIFVRNYLSLLNALLKVLAGRERSDHITCASG